MIIPSHPTTKRVTCSTNSTTTTTNPSPQSTVLSASWLDRGAVGLPALVVARLDARGRQSVDVHVSQEPAHPGLETEHRTGRLGPDWSPPGRGLVRGDATPEVL